MLKESYTPTKRVVLVIAPCSCSIWNELAVSAMSPIKLICSVTVGEPDGDFEGLCERGESVGEAVGRRVGDAVGRRVGDAVGRRVGLAVGEPDVGELDVGCADVGARSRGRGSGASKVTTEIGTFTRTSRDFPDANKGRFYA